MPVAAVPRRAPRGWSGCCCKDGEACTTWGKHLVSGLGVARTEDDVERVWPATDIRVRSGFIGIAVLTGSESQIVVLDVGEHAAMTKARFKITDHVLTQTTPIGRAALVLPDRGVRGGHRGPHRDRAGHRGLGAGRRRVRGAAAAAPATTGRTGRRRRWHAGITDATDALKMRLTAAGLVHGVDADRPRRPWRTRPGTPLVGGAPRTYTRRGDVRRLVDTHGDKILYTPGLGWRVLDRVRLGRAGALARR